jgi:hypothetical protein
MTSDRFIGVMIGYFAGMVTTVLGFASIGGIW